MTRSEEAKLILRIIYLFHRKCFLLLVVVVMVVVGLLFWQNWRLTQDSLLANQALYHLSASCNPFCDGYF
jgi:predicted negative regulator of RcsB-dependent stress response